MYVVLAYVLKLLLLHCRQYQCPKLPPNQRPPKRKGAKPGRKKATQQSDDSSGKKLVQNGDRLSSSYSDSDEESTFEPFLTLSKPRGLIDGLSRFFTPSDKRKSRVSLSSSAAFVKIKTHKKSKVQTKNHSQSRQAASKLIRKSKILQVNRKRRKQVCDPPGSGQLKGLFDGLSHIFSAQGERKRTLPVYNNSRKRKKQKLETEVPSVYNSACDISLNGSLSVCSDSDLTFSDKIKCNLTATSQSVVRQRGGRGRGRGRGRGLSRSDSPRPRLGLLLMDEHLSDGEMSDHKSTTSNETDSRPPQGRGRGRGQKKGKPSLMASAQ